MSKMWPFGRAHVNQSLVPFSCEGRTRAPSNRSATRDGLWALFRKPGLLNSIPFIFSDFRKEKTKTGHDHRRTRYQTSGPNFKTGRKKAENTRTFIKIHLKNTKEKKENQLNTNPTAIAFCRL
jgi:hypothetical protein